MTTPPNTPSQKHNLPKDVDFGPGRVFEILMSTTKPTGDALCRLIFQEPPYDKHDVSALLEYGQPPSYSKNPGLWTTLIATRLLNELLADPENVALAAWGEALIKTDIASCANALLNGEMMRSYKDIYGDNNALNENARATSIVSQLWVAAFKQFTVPKGGLLNALKEKRLTIENGMVGLAVIGNWIGFEGTPRPHDIRRIGRVHEKMVKLFYMTKEQEDFIQLGAHLKHARLRLEMTPKEGRVIVRGMKPGKM